MILPLDVARNIAYGDLQGQPANKIGVDCSNKNPNWASATYGIFMCFSCSCKHLCLPNRMEVLFVELDCWSGFQIRKMEVGGNEDLNNFLSQRGIPRETDIFVKYTTNAAADYHQRIQALAKGKT